MPGAPGLVINASEDMSCVDVITSQWRQCSPVLLL